MPPQSPSIQSFFSSSPSKSISQAGASSPAKSLAGQLFPSPPSQLPSASSGIETGDGFTAEEIDAVLHPPSAQWTPTQGYEEADIGRLEPCPKFVTFIGRIVNFYDMVRPSKRPLAAKGCLKLMVADDTGALTVRLWYANTDYKVRLGQLVTIWTVHVSHGEQASLAPAAAPLFTSIFPERERSCHIMLHENSDNGTMCKKPYGWTSDTQSLPGLMTVKNFTDGGYDVNDCKVLVCVKSIGARKKFTNKAGFSSELMSIGVFDDTAEATLTLCGAVCSSASHWQPSHTILLISHPGWRIDRTTRLSLNGNTRIDVDPDMADALWLRALAQRLTKREHVNPPFPDGVFDTEAAETAAVRILYTLADIDEFARANPKERFMGYISVIVTELNLVLNYKRNMLMSTECCGMPLFANAVAATCRQCERLVPLRINPRIPFPPSQLGPLIDETAQIASGKLLLSDTAWHQLLGRTPAQFVADGIETLRLLEQRLLFVRLSLGFGWCLEGSSSSTALESIEDEDEDGEEAKDQLRGRKRKRLDVFHVREKERERDKEKGKESLESGNAVEKAMSGDGVGEVGRLCIWCVKM
ncbi:hypothetical protein K491DRAFT_755187 [Lophiostoma macrostomum CBS 122681]|uniref:Nucleic acid-binding protein n=1 Tax=Lophiostoma macrostomum CBS 122681 TaxID=1314788 RepID=A0A6A6TL23_9PLEO|nr:hypothetical protein K491DRAFT_755187 [Lophiostoma macrostomum CBS 122681]